jgi:hypothetical protein
MKSGVSGVVLFFLLTSSTWAQVSTSRIEGTVTDKSGAVVANVAVKVTNESTGVSYDVKTSTSGTYTVPSLVPGQYSVTVTSAGFETYKSGHNVLSVG